MLEMLEDMGWTVIEVEKLCVKAALVRGVSIILIRSDASEDDIAEVADRVLMGQPKGGKSD